MILILEAKAFGQFGPVALCTESGQILFANFEPSASG